VTVLDACALIAYFRGEPARPEVVTLLDSGDTVLTATGMVEVVDRLVRLSGVHAREVALDLAELGLAEPPRLSGQECREAGSLRARHYRRVGRPVSLADCVAATTAQRLQRPLATSDPALLDLCAEEGIPYVSLPGSDGTRHVPAG